MYRKYKRFMTKYQNLQNKPKEENEQNSKYTDNLMEDVIKYKGDKRPIKQFWFSDYTELNMENLQFVKFFTQFDGKNPLCPEQTGVPMVEHNTIESANQEQNLISKKFHEIPCNDRLRILYYFCLSRALQGDKEIQQNINNAQTPASIENQKEQNATPTENTNKAVKRAMPLGADKDGNEYFYFEENKDGKLYKIKSKSMRISESKISECMNAYENTRKFLDTLTKSENTEDLKLKESLESKISEMEMRDKETQAREQTRVRKLQSLNRSKKAISNAQRQYADSYKTDVPLINFISNNVMTRTQLQNLKNRFTKPVTHEDLVKEKYERQKLERQRRLERRQKVFFLSRNLKDYSRKHYNKYEWMDDSEQEESYGHSSGRRKKSILK